MSSFTRSRGYALAGIVLLAGCQTTGGGAPVADVESRLAGTVIYRERMALPADATLEVRLEDVSRADAPAIVIAQQEIEAEGRQVPIPFELSYLPGRIEPDRRYALRAQIRGADGALLFATTAHQAALAEGAPTEGIEIRVQRVAALPPVAHGLDGDWRLVAMQKAGAPEVVVSDDLPYTMSFGPDQRVSGKADCNSYGGGYAVPAEGQLYLTGVVTTLMACAAPSVADAFLGALGRLNRYELDGTTLRLTTAGGDILKLARPAPAPSEAPTAVPNAPPPLGKPWVDAAARGVRFRALGNEPSWVLEVADRTLTIVTDLGQRRAEFPLAAPVVKGDTTIWRSGGGGEGVVAVAQRKPCADDMSGERMDASAAVTFEGETYKGCGRFLR